MTESEAIEKLKNMRLFMQITDNNSDCKKKAHNEAMRKGLKPMLDDNIKFYITVA